MEKVKEKIHLHLHPAFALLALALIVAACYVTDLAGLWLLIHWGWLLAGSILAVGTAAIKPSWQAYRAIHDHQQERADREAFRGLLMAATDQARRGYDLEMINPHSGASLKLSNPYRASMQRRFAMAEEDEQVEAEEEQRLLPAPKRIDLIEQIENGLTLPDEDLSVFGYVDRQPKQVSLFEEENNFVNSVFVVGIQGQGKSTVGTLLAAYTVNHRGYLLVIDPDAEEGQSLTKRLGPLTQFLLCEVANTPEKAERVLSIAEAELDKPGDYPVLLLIDEFSMMMRHMVSKDKLAKWKAIAPRIASVVEDYATRGRKRRRRACVFGQIPNATRAGGTELRDQCAYIIFNSPAKKAGLILQDAKDDTIADRAPELLPGNAIVSPAKSSDTYIMRFPYPDLEALKIIAESSSEARSEEFYESSTEVLEAETEEMRTPSERLGTPTELALEADSRRIKSLKRQGKTQEEIIYLLWGARKGGGPKYRKAKARYLECIKHAEKSGAFVDGEMDTSYTA